MSSKKEIVLITGAGGLVANRLKTFLDDKYELRFLTRKASHSNEYEWNIRGKRIDVNALKGVNYIVHLAGAGIADKRWTKQRKQEIISSRVDSLSLIINALQENGVKLKALVSTSAIGYYGSINSDTIFKESDAHGEDFLSSVCVKWEAVAHQFSDLNLCERELILRFGVVLSNKGGAFPKMLKPIVWNLGAALGNGNQYMPWIHIDDLCRMIQFSIEQEKLQGVYNAVAPEHVNNKSLTDMIGSVYGKKIYLPNVPSAVLKLLFGQASVLLLKGSRVSCQKIQDAGFKFEFPNILGALKALFTKG